MRSGKILFFDIDGTLYREGRGMPGSTREAILRCADRGHTLMLCTGRGASSIPEVIRQLPFDGGVFGCGTYVTTGEKVLVDAAVMGPRCQEIIDALYENRCPFFINNSDYIYYDPAYIPAGFEEIIQRMKYDYEGRLRPLSELDGRISKMTAYPDDPSLVPRIIQRVSPWFDVLEHREYPYIELLLKGHTKGTGTELILNSLGIPKENSYGFGDSANDIPLLEATGHGVIMGDAPEEIKGRFLRAEAFGDDGLARILEELGLI